MSNAERDERQCRICLDGPDPELGRLIRPCLCRGSISVRVLLPPSLTNVLDSAFSSMSMSVACSDGEENQRVLSFAARNVHIST